LTRIVCDASVALAWVQGDSGPAWLAELRDGITECSVEVAVPGLFWLEVGNALSRRADLSDEQALEGLVRLQALGLETLDSDQALHLRAVQLARAHALTTYDALYLALADALDAPLATLDGRLATAAATMARRFPPETRRAVRERPARDASDGTSLAALGARLAELRG
jgi:predicted nucleic acid-binding protein